MSHSFKTNSPHPLLSTSPLSTHSIEHVSTPNHPIVSFTSLFVLVRQGIRREAARERAVPRRKHHGERRDGRGKGRAEQQDHPQRSQQSLSPYQRHTHRG